VMKSSLGERSVPPTTGSFKPLYPLIRNTTWAQAVSLSLASEGLVKAVHGRGNPERSRDDPPHPLYTSPIYGGSTEHDLWLPLP